MTMSPAEGGRAAIPRDAIAFRTATPEDHDFFRLLYHATRAEEMRHFPFNEEQKVAFLNQQFHAQHTYYAEHYPDCERNLIVVNGERAGRMWIQEHADEIRLIDIALMPEWRGSGIGGILLRELLERGRAAGKPVTIHVEIFNPAMRLYKRLGFVKKDSNGVYDLMEWKPDQVNTAS
jgi:ribosomal protein S18 acetylase RimI-like enzyme